jgi:hypothetical protein
VASYLPQTPEMARAIALSLDMELEMGQFTGCGDGSDLIYQLGTTIIAVLFCFGDVADSLIFQSYKSVLRMTLLA